MKKLLSFISIATALVACSPNDPDDLFGKSAAERTAEAQAELRTQLTTPQLGWKFNYFTDNSQLGGFTFLMKFTPEGLVEMNSDMGETYTPTTSKYEIKQGQGTMLSFTTKNYLHQMADAVNPIDLLGTGYKGEFEYIYHGKEGDKLKFKTQRTNQFIYFEPATQTDWDNIENAAQTLSNLISDTYRYYLRVTQGGNTKDYDLTLDKHRVLLISEFEGQNIVAKAGVTTTPNGLLLSPPIQLQGKTISQFTTEGTTSPTVYKATADDLTAEIIFEAAPTTEHLGDGYKHFDNGGSLLTLDQYSLNSPFVHNLELFTSFHKIDDTHKFDSMRIVLNSSQGQAQILLGYTFPDTKKIEYLFMNFTYRITNKRLTFRGGLIPIINSTNIEIFTRPENEFIIRGAERCLNNFTRWASRGLLIKATPWVHRGLEVAPVFMLQHPTNYDEYIPYFVPRR